MTRIGRHLLSLALATPFALGAAPEAQANQQLQLKVERILREYNFDSVDVSQLTNGQLSAIYLTAYGNRNQSDRRALIKSHLRGGLLRFLR